jgi:hypothetical protein
MLKSGGKTAMNQVTRPWLFLQVVHYTGGRETGGNQPAVVFTLRKEEPKRFSTLCQSENAAHGLLLGAILA